MKKIFIVLLTLAICLPGCKKFLDVKPVGARYLNELEAVKSTMGAWMYNFSKNGKFGSSQDAPWPWIPNMYGSYGGSTFMSLADVWSFKDMNEQENALSEWDKKVIDRYHTVNHWNTYYELIGLMNLVIIEGTNADGDEETRDIVLGEAYFQRAFYFFKLLQYYAPVDDPSIGIPVHLEISVDPEDSDLSRQPQEKVYAQIFSDIAEAELRMERTGPKETFNIMFDKDWMYRIIAQIYQWKASTAAAQPGDWENAVKYAELALKAPNSLNQLTLPFDFETVEKEVFLKHNTSWDLFYGFIWNKGYPETLGIGYDSYSPIANTYSYDVDVWRELYKDGDKRKTEWFLANDDKQKPSSEIDRTDLNTTRKTGSDYYGYRPYIMLLRLSETWLIRVEALAMSGNIAAAQEALATWRSLRYDDSAQLEMPASAEEIQHEVYLERKREFLGEADIMWLDMKRFHVSDERKVKDFDAKLEANDFRYQFMIPTDEGKYNPQMIVNPGWSNLVY